MNARRIAMLPTIRAKLGSVIVFAVALTILGVYVVLGLALRNSFRDADLVELLGVAQSRSVTTVTSSVEGISLVTLREQTFAWTGAQLAEPPRFDGGVHVGVEDGIEYAAVPLRDGTGGMLYAVRGEPGFWRATTDFFLRFWWQLLASGAVAAAIALVIARWLARGMTQPLRDMAAAASEMERGAYGRRVTTTSRDEVGQLAVAFNRMSGELENVERQRRELVANVSHELKTPISALRAHLENMIDGVEPSDPQTLQVMLTQSERLGRLVDQLLDLSRLESGELALHRDALAVGPLIDDVVSEISVMPRAAEVELATDVPSTLPNAFADGERIHQVLFNLLDNAVRFTPSGGRITIAATSEDDAIRVSVTDPGPGIPPEHLERVFERFYRVDTARSRGAGGTGIGLAIARSVVEAHGGRITATSDPGHGSTFTFELPAVRIPGTPGALERVADGSSPITTEPTHGRSPVGATRRNR
jgi:signal transduction histidine kinase